MTAEEIYNRAISALIGTSEQRNLTHARRLFLQAADAGHIDAAFFEAALRANGSGRDIDWAGAVDMLRRVAPQSDLAREQLSLLYQMTLDKDGFPKNPITPKRLIDAKEIYLFPAFLSQPEINSLIEAAVDILEPSQVVDPRLGTTVPHPVRTSSGAAIGPTRENLVVGAINRRIAYVSNTVYENGEPVMLLHYAPGQQYRPHLDTFGNRDYERTHTMILYLNSGYSGGETVFPNLNVSINAKTGDALLFRNLDEDGKPDRDMVHAGLPVQRGEKWIATRWIRNTRCDPWTMGGE